MTPPIFALLTDFGLEDEYVGLMKAALLARLPEARIFDLCHAVPPRDIAHGAFLLDRALPHLPPVCFTIAVVDPGVGGARRLIAARLAGRWFFAPDNGLLTPVLRQNPQEIIALRPADQLLATASATFHGRDLLAPMAAMLAATGGAANLGESVGLTSCVMLPPPSPRQDDGGLQGKVIHIDHFGNLTTNIRRDMLPETAIMTECRVTVSGDEIIGISSTYSEKSLGNPLALWDSHNHLEIAVAGGSAAKSLGAGKSAAVRIHWRGFAATPPVVVHVRTESSLSTKGSSIMTRHLLSILCFCLLLPSLGLNAQDANANETSPARKKPGVFTTLRQRIAATWHSNDYDFYLPAYTWHNRLLYDSEHIEEYNEAPWGAGLGKYMRDEDGDSHFLFIMSFQDSHNRFEPYGGYAFQKNWPIDAAKNWSGGIGYVLGITARDQYGYIPFPLPLPIAGIQYKNFAVQSAYIPGGYNDGNVLFTWLRWHFH